MKKLNVVFKCIRGFTFFEIITVVIVLSIIAIPIIDLFYDSQTESIIYQKTLDAQAEADRGMRFILEDLRKVDSEKTSIGDATILNGTIGGGSDVTDVIIIRFSDTNQAAYGVYNKVLYKYTSSAKIDIAALTPSILATGNLLCNNVTEFKVTSTVVGYNISTKIDPDNVGRFEVPIVSITNSFTPRFNMNIR